MKKVRFMMMIAIAIFMGTTMVSCLNSDSKIPMQDFVSVNEDIYSGNLILKSDTWDYTYVPSNPSFLKYSGSETYAKHVIIQFELQEDEELTTEKYIGITITGVTDLLGKEFCNPDTLTHNPGVGLYEIGGAYTANNYLTFAFHSAYTTNLSLNNYDVYLENADGNNLYVRFNQNLEPGNYSSTISSWISFELPNIRMISSKFPELEFYGADKDSVNIILVASKYYNESDELVLKNIKTKLRYY